MSYGQRLIISSNCKLYNSVYYLGDHIYIQREVECTDMSNSTVVFSDSDSLIWGIITNCQEYKNKANLEKILVQERKLINCLDN